MTNRTVVGALAVVAVGVFAAGCNSKVTGGGSLQGLGGDRATFSVDFDACKGADHAKGGFDYKDKSGAVSVKGTLLGLSLPLNGECVFETTSLPDLGPATGPTVSYMAAATWVSNNPKQPGQGVAIICVRDGGEGKKADSADFVSIRLWRDGENILTVPPFHANAGTLRGNMQSHDCPSSPPPPI